MIDLTDKKLLITLLRHKGIKLNTALGQHFLIDKSVLNSVVASAKLQKTDKVIEIGVGVGVLTQELVARAGEVWAYEIDGRFAVIADANLGEAKNYHLIVSDFLDAKLPEMGKFKVVANLPYQITTPVIRKFLEQEQRPEKMVILIQKEVAERLAAKPGSAKRGWVTVLTQMFGRVEIVKIVPKSSFLPEPKVESAVIVIDDIKEPDFNWKRVISVVKAGFSSKRRQLPNTLSGGLGIDIGEMRQLVEKAEIDKKLRAEDLTTEQWVKLTEIIDSLSG